MPFRFRLTAHNRSPGFFFVAEPSAAIQLPNGLTVTVVPRDADSLSEATRYHFDAGGFSTEAEARSAGEQLRRTLQFLIALLGLTLQVPVVDVESSSISESVRSEFRDSGIEVRNGRSGLSVFPDDGSLELVPAGTGRVRPSEPLYLLSAIGTAWQVDITFDDESRRALELLALSSADVSPKTQFLTTYLALEQLIPKGRRSDRAVEILSVLSATITRSDLGSAERDAILGGLANLRDEPYSVALRAFASTITQPAQFGGINVVELVNRSIRLRNSIAHRHATPSEDVAILTSALRQFAIATIWTKHQVPALSIDRPADRVVIDRFEHRLL